ncbi:MAG TPA: DUF4920 domain-containing protein [Vicinamibacterales bacterium]
MKALMVAAVFAAVVGVSAEEIKLGAGVSLKEATPITALAKTPADFVGKTVRIDGVATAVCTEMGCWMAVAPEGDTSGVTVRLKVEDGKIVFPVSAKGKKVSAEGVFEKVGAGDAKEAAAENAKVDPKASQEYQIKATGAIIR